jgi:hypothetical protein
MPATVTVHPIERVNPGLFIREADIGTDDPALVVDDSMANTASFGDPPQDYVLLAQMCSIMSVYWIQDNTKRLLSGLDPDLQRETALIVYANQTPDAQYDFAQSLLGFEPATVEEVAARAQNPQGTTRVLLYSDRHVSAATIGANGIVYFDPETGAQEDVGLDEFLLYLAQAQRALVG